MSGETVYPVPNKESGFTLVEVLISMFIFSLISVGALIALTTTLDAREAAEAKLAELEQLSAMRTLMADDFDKMIFRENRDGLGGMIEEPELQPWADQLSLTRRGRPNPDGLFSRGDLMRVSWRVEEGQLIRSFLPHENPAYVDPPIDRVIMQGINSMSFDVLLDDNLLQGMGSTIDEMNGDPAGTAFAGLRSAQPQSVSQWAIDIRLTHADGTQTRHLFEMPRG